MHNFRYSLKILFKNKMLIFWTFMFPLILGTFFKMAFNDIEKNEMLDIIDIAFVENDSNIYNDVYKKVFLSLSDKNDKDRFFNTKFVSKKEANKMLLDGKISGYVLIDDDVKVVVKENGINETVLKQVTEEINETIKVSSNLYSDITDNEVLLMRQKIFNDYFGEGSAKYKTNIEDISNNNLSYTMIEYYTLIAMACLYGGVIGMYSVNKVLPNMSENGKRVAISPVSKWNLIFSSVVSSYIVQLMGLFLLFLYTIFVLKVDYGNNLGLVLLTSAVGSFSGLSLGVFVASTFKKNENTKIGIMISLSMLGSFFSGMMGITMKFIIDKNIPIINKLNPVNMITDALYSLYYYEGLERFNFNIISLLLFSFLMIGISVFSLRRQKYDSI